MKIVPGTICLLVMLSVGGCATSPPDNVEDICSIFEEKRGWYKDARRAGKRWKVPIPTLVAFTYQESSFDQDAKPPRTKLLGLIPWTRPSSAKGYVQATDEAWTDYRKDTGRWRASRKDFEDAMDFVGWYNYKSHKRLGIPMNDATSLYLAYHEGHSGYARSTYRGKSSLMRVARKVQARADRYAGQLARCEDELNKPWWWPF
ncbi:MAG: hypothetical protein V3U43_01430 [Pseudomonadales bacterium]